MFDPCLSSRVIGATHVAHQRNVQSACGAQVAEQRGVREMGSMDGGEKDGAHQKETDSAGR